MPYEDLRKPLAKEQYICFQKLKNGIWNIGSISKKILSKLVRMTKS
jgi:hypothetical protein